MSGSAPSRTETELAASSHRPTAVRPDPCAPTTPYRVVAGLARPTIRVLFRPSVRGLDRLPGRGGFVLCSNQLSPRPKSCFGAGSIPMSPRT